MLSNAYFLSKFRFDSAENEPAKNLKNFVITKFAIYLASFIYDRLSVIGLRADVSSRIASRRLFSRHKTVSFLNLGKRSQKKPPLTYKNRC